MMTLNVAQCAYYIENSFNWLPAHLFAQKFIQCRISQFYEIACHILFLEDCDMTSANAIISN